MASGVLQRKEWQSSEEYQSSHKLKLQRFLIWKWPNNLTFDKHLTPFHVETINVRSSLTNEAGVLEQFTSSYFYANEPSDFLQILQIHVHIYWQI